VAHFYADIIEDYKAAKHVMYANHIEKDEEVVDFEIRYDKICKDVSELEKRMTDNAEHYRRLKKLQYSLQLAQDPHYVYGPAYPGVGAAFKEENEEIEQLPLWHKLDQTRTIVEKQSEEPDFNAAFGEDMEATKE